MSYSPDEAAKLQQHLQLLRGEYAKLQARLHQVEMEKRSSTVKGGDQFAAKILLSVAKMHAKDKYRLVKGKDGG